MLKDIYVFPNMGDGGLSVGAANTSTEIVAIAMAGAGQKSSYTLIKKVYRLEVILHPAFAAIWLQSVCHSNTPFTVVGAEKGGTTPAPLLKVAQGGFKHKEGLI